MRHSARQQAAASQDSFLFGMEENLDMQFLQQFLECYHRDELQGGYPHNTVWFLERTCYELDLGHYRRPTDTKDGRLALSLLLACERVYLGLHLDKVIPVRSSIKRVGMEVCNPKVPSAFDGLRLMWLSDLHLDVGNGKKTVDILCDLVEGSRPDFLVYGGDYRHGHKALLSEKEAAVFPLMKRITDAANPRMTVALLGNHDILEMLPHFKTFGAVPMHNSALLLEEGKDRMVIVGLDDSYRYYQPIAKKLMHESFTPESYNVVLSHNHQIADVAAAAGGDLLIAGHTHAGQFKNKLMELFHKKFCGFDERSHGLWSCGNMVGITNAGIASSAIPIRNVEGEVLSLTFRSRGYSEAKFTA